MPKGRSRSSRDRGFWGQGDRGTEGISPQQGQPKELLGGKSCIWQGAHTWVQPGFVAVWGHPGAVWSAPAGVAPGLCTRWSPSLHPPLSSLSQQLPLLLLVSFPGEAFPDPQASSQGPCSTLGALSSPPLWHLPSYNCSFKCHVVSLPHPALARLVYSPASRGSSSQKLNLSAC